MTLDGSSDRLNTGDQANAFLERETRMSDALSQLLLLGRGFSHPHQERPANPLASLRDK
jgi:hypothetical protein